MWLPTLFEKRSAAFSPLPRPCATRSAKTSRGSTATSMTKSRGSVEGRE